MSRRLLVLGGLAAITLTLAACSSAGDLSIRNESRTDVTVVVDGGRDEVTADGGLVLLGKGCTRGDVLVEFPSGTSVVVPGPVCPDQEIVIHDGVAALEPVAAPSR
ncbi:hypothetical protein IC607_08930 [Cellulomonas sp. JH27-2]|uniref:hypothetical protein n=1 Tax=Cellulomonas sp. JH27-2 TaxID=2774139 RepID=UPI00177C88A5|nr:hypothetical protein [Cellulomonas sp. JH27-2]MBD8059091.1 hypothetical protein [Cellulomonas sp. JH27-2]